MDREEAASGEAMADEAVVEEIPVDECRRLLESQVFGRLGVVVGNRPEIFPVNYAFAQDAVVFRTAEGTKLFGSGFGRAVFEIDGFDPATRTGWSVIVHGVSSEISEALDPDSAAFRRLDLEPWVPGPRPHWVAIRMESISGRRVRRR